MDLISGLRSELFRPLVTLLVPGAIAIAPYWVVLQSRVPEVVTFKADNPSALVAILLVVIIAAGLTLEDIGARIEREVWDRRLRTLGEFANFDAQWHQYLSLKTQDEIVGQRYLRTILVRMKFEISTGPALIIHLIGLIWVNHVLAAFSAGTMLQLSIAYCALAAYLIWESYQSCYALAELRRDVIEACKVLPKSAQLSIRVE
ncbi:MAG TPA: hypothetical protein VMW17_24320 [Candidatus Binatia bacterium]|nr:hypothetical protein [Candidatus Binatia bacterium]